MVVCGEASGDPHLLHADERATRRARLVGQAQRGQRTQTKTSAGRRTIDLGPAAVRPIREQQLARIEALLATVEGRRAEADQGVQHNP